MSPGRTQTNQFVAVTFFSAINRRSVGHIKLSIRLDHKVCLNSVFSISLFPFWSSSLVSVSRGVLTIEASRLGSLDA